MTGPRLTYYPSGVLLTAPYDADLTPWMVGELKRQPRDPRPPFAADHHYAALHLLPSAPRELIDSAYRTLVKLNHPDRLPVPERDRGHRRMVEINGAYEALHAHAAPGGV